jgi:glycosyltransferase involved in cell wall biosynthesis
MPTLERAVKTCDVVYFDNAYALQDLAMIGLKFRYRKPVISAHHSVLLHHRLHDLYVHLVSRNVIRFFDACHVLNSDDASVLSKWGAKNVHLIPLGVDTDRFTPPKSYGEGRTMRVALVGRLTEQKGIDKFLSALAIVNSDLAARERTEFIVVGSGPLAPLVQAAAERHRNLRYVGPVVDDRLLDIYRDSDLIVMPSRYETMGIVALEAQACGLPVIVAKTSGLSDIIIPDVTGTILRRNEPHELASAILSYLDLHSSDFARYVGMRIAARENVERRFSLEQTTQSLSRMIMGVAKSGCAFDPP